MKQEHRRTATAFYCGFRPSAFRFRSSFAVFLMAIHMPRAPCKHFAGPRRFERIRNLLRRAELLDTRCRACLHDLAMQS